MSGRRTRDAVKKALISNGFPSDTKVVIAGLSNTYSDYVTTFEEYQVHTCSPNRWRVNECPISPSIDPAL